MLNNSQGSQGYNDLQTVQNAIAILIDQISKARGGGRTIVIDKNWLNNQLSALQNSLPAAVHQAQAVLKEKETTLSRAQQEAEMQRQTAADDAQRLKAQAEKEAAAARAEGEKARADAQKDADAAKQEADTADALAQTASTAAQSANAAADEARRSLRRDAESLLPQRFTAPDGPVQLTFALMTTVLAEEADALHTAQAGCAAALRQAEADCARRTALDADRQARTRQRPALEQAASDADRTAAAQSARADALERQITDQRAALPCPQRTEAQAALDALEAKRRTFRTGKEQAEAALRRAQQTHAAAKAAVDALLAQQTAAAKAVPEQPLEVLQARQAELSAARTALREQAQQLAAQLLPNRTAAENYRAAAAARAALEQRWQWVSALAATAGGTLTSKQKIRLEAYIQMNYLDRILRHANTRLMQMTAGQYELERIGAENQRSQSGLDLGVIDHYNGTRRSVKTLSGGESF